MTLFVDASALVAILAKEAERDPFATMIAEDEDPLWSPVSRWETLTALCRSYGLTPERSQLAVDDFAAEIALRLVSIGSREAELASEAYRLYGRGRHPAQLNMGDCFAYACAKTNDAQLLYKGDDFSKTDLA